MSLQQQKQQQRQHAGVALAPCQEEEQEEVTAMMGTHRSMRLLLCGNTMHGVASQGHHRSNSVSNHRLLYR